MEFSYQRLQKYFQLKRDVIRFSLVKENWIEKTKITNGENNLGGYCQVQAGNDKGLNQSSGQKQGWGQQMLEYGINKSVCLIACLGG